MLHLIHSLGDDFGTTIVVVTHQPEVAATFPRTVTMKGGRVGAEGHGGSEYAVVGEDGVLHLPAPTHVPGSEALEHVAAIAVLRETVLVLGT